MSFLALFCKTLHVDAHEIPVTHFVSSGWRDDGFDFVFDHVLVLRTAVAVLPDGWCAEPLGADSHLQCFQMCNFGLAMSFFVVILNVFWL